MRVRSAVRPGASPTDAGPIRELGPLEALWRHGGQDYLPLRLLLLAKLIDQHTARLLKRRAGISVAEWRVIAQLGVLHQGSVREMARQGCVDPAEVSRAAATLERRGYVARHANARDRRSPRFALTSAGSAHYARFRAHWRQFQRSLVADLSDAERAIAERALTRMVRACLAMRSPS
ncbi:MAG TPA: MarR family winged helix-turn-helix transcriptional regulator [Steroidobacteraceae bacterium]|nr:MarR family winged helix-turn-helix transcriptional regulator [Steroidobacteraceae bacterium]